MAVLLIVLIVSPLKRIVKDQIEEMEDLGILSIVEVSTKEDVPLPLREAIFGAAVDFWIFFLGYRKRLQERKKTSML